MDDASYEIIGDVAVFRSGGDRGLEEGVRLVKDVILRVKLAGITKLLVDVSAVGFAPPTVADRHWLMTEWAGAGRGAVRLALLIRPEFMDPQHFGTAVARNRGLAFKAFLAEERAMQWLLEPHTADPPR